MLLLASCWREALICIALALRDAAVCADRFAVGGELMVLAMVLAVSLSKMSSSPVLLVKPAKWLQDE